MTHIIFVYWAQLDEVFLKYNFLHYLVFSFASWTCLKCHNQYNNIHPDWLTLLLLWNKFDTDFFQFPHPKCCYFQIRCILCLKSWIIIFCTGFFFLVTSILKHNRDECTLKKRKPGRIGNILRARSADIYNNDIFWYNLYKMTDTSICWSSKYYYYQYG